MRRLVIPFLPMVALIAAACGGGGGSSSGGVVNPGPSPLTASFTADQPNPGNLTVSMASGGANGDQALVRVNVTGVLDVFAGAFDVHFDPANVEYAGYSPGSLLEQGGYSVNYTVRQPTGTTGMVVVGVSRVGQVPGQNVDTTRTLINLVFRVKGHGSFPLQFGDGASLLDSNLSRIGGLTTPWPAGTLQGS